MPSKYKFYNAVGTYFITLTVVEWIDIFTRPIYRYIILDSLRYAQSNKGLKIHAWVIMSNHLHLIVSAKEGYNLSDIFRDFKKFTAKKIVNDIVENSEESRKNWMLWIFKSHGKKNSNNKFIQFWIQDNHAVDLRSNKMKAQRLNYLHNNPVKAEIVEKAEHYLYSSAIDYTGGMGLLEVELL